MCSLEILTSFRQEITVNILAAWQSLAEPFLPLWKGNNVPETISRKMPTFKNHYLQKLASKVIDGAVFTSRSLASPHCMWTR